MIRNLHNSFLTLGVQYNNFLYKHLHKINMYYPVIPPDGAAFQNIPKVYNESGRELDLYFLASPNYPLGGEYLLFDQFNWGIKKHIYDSREMLRRVGIPKVQFGYIGESRSIIPNEYKLIEKHTELQKELDAVFTFDERLLNRFSNAQFFPYGARPWYGAADDKRYEKKDKNISIICSNKFMTDMHKIRIAVARECRTKGLADVYGSINGSYYEDYDAVFSNYRFSIVIENEISDYYFTEKITSCFLAQTIPIYLGARKIGDFFNANGIIQIQKGDLLNLLTLLKKCTPELYEERIPAVLDNYQRVKEYDNMWDWWYENYGIKYRDI